MQIPAKLWRIHNPNHSLHLFIIRSQVQDYRRPQRGHVWPTAVAPRPPQEAAVRCPVCPATPLPRLYLQWLVYWKRKGEQPNRRYCPNPCRSCRRGCRFSSSITNNFPGFDPHECPAVLGDARRGIRSGSVWGYWSIVRVGIGGIKAGPPPAGPGFLFPKASFFTWYAAF